MAESNPGNGEWAAWWNARQAALEAVLGKADDVVGHALVPLDMGGDAGGAADLLYFRHHLAGRVAVTADLIGNPAQRRNSLGAYELMICHRDDDDAGPNLISRLANYALEADIEPGHTIDIGPATPKGSTIAAFLFFEYARFEVRGEAAGLLLCLGITPDELKQCRRGKRAAVETALKAKGVYPFTEWKRKSVLK